MDDIITLKCPSCGGSLQVGANTAVLRCKHCGVEHLVRHEADSISLESYARCPKCGRNDKVEKVTAILRIESNNLKLTEILAQPHTPSYKPQPKPIPKPEKATKPKPPPKPSFTYKKPNKLLIVLGIVSIIISVIFISLDIIVSDSSQESSKDNLIFLSIFCLTPTIFSGLLGLVAFYFGFKSETKLNESIHVISEMINHQNKLAKNIAITALAFILFGITTTCFVFSFFISFSEEQPEFSILAVLLTLSLLPAIVGLTLFINMFVLRKLQNINTDSLKVYEVEIKNWEEQKYVHESEFRRITQEWQEENVKIQESWEEEKAAVKKKWRLAKERWNNLYFCRRDDVVFLPGEGDFAPVEKIQEYLNK